MNNHYIQKYFQNQMYLILENNVLKSLMQWYVKKMKSLKPEIKIKLIVRIILMNLNKKHFLKKFSKNKKNSY